VLSGHRWALALEGQAWPELAKQVKFTGSLPSRIPTIREYQVPSLSNMGEGFINSRSFLSAHFQHLQNNRCMASQDYTRVYYG